ncbi:MAG: PQQ-dependent sugar dehydrogenase [Gemmatimonadaceae bacterium]|nr:PQQ-dependent sugar dehydrogenase [Chitinophagaceae bacterium]
MRILYSYSRQFLCLTITIFFLTAAFSQPVVSFASRATGLSSPIELAAPNDNTNRLFIVQQGGTILIYNGSTVSPTPFLNMTGLILSGGERGLLSMAFDPNYTTNRNFYVYYNSNSSNPVGAIEIARYTTDAGNPNIADPASRRVMMTIPHPTYDNHNGGHMAFGPDGNLYFATGDGGGGGDPDDNAQDGTSLLGKMIRIKPNSSEIFPYYTVPADNPWVADPTILDEIWATGLRNPFRWSFDRLTGDMWIGDVGQGQREEVNKRAANATGGINYGWDCWEGNFQYNGGGCPIASNYAPPLLDYPHTTAAGGFSITGGYVYRGTNYPAMYGHYIFADFVSGNVWALPPNGAAADTIMYKLLRGSISSFGETQAGELYATTLNGVLYEVVATATGSLPVKITSFNAITKNGVNELIWTTDTEVSLRQYEIEYSLNGTEFQQAGVIAATNSGSYRYSHMLAPRDRLFYRLRMVDIDGRFEYSKTVSLNFGSEDKQNFVAPSVVTNNQISLMLTGDYNQVQLISMEGKEVWRQNINGRSGRINFTLPATLPGTYIVRMSNNDNAVSQQILIK